MKQVPELTRLLELRDSLKPIVSKGTFKEVQATVKGIRSALRGKPAAVKPSTITVEEFVEQKSTIGYNDRLMKDRMTVEFQSSIFQGDPGVPLQQGPLFTGKPIAGGQTNLFGGGL